MEIKTFLVEGMFCKNCKSHVESGIKNLSGIENVIVDISNGEVRVYGTRIVNDEIKGAVEQTGYIYKGEINTLPHPSENWIS